MITDVPELPASIEERGRANRFDDALTRIIGLCAPNSKRGTHPRLDKVFGRMMDIDCQARHPEEWKRPIPCPRLPRKERSCVPANYEREPTMTDEARAREFYVDTPETRHEDWGLYTWMTAFARSEVIRELEHVLIHGTSP